MLRLTGEKKWVGGLCSFAKICLFRLNKGFQLVVFLMHVVSGHSPEFTALSTNSANNEISL